METHLLIIEILSGCVGAMLLLMMKWLRDDIKCLKEDIKEIRTDIKEMKKTLESHGNRLTAIETGLHMFEWFQTKGPVLKAKGSDES